jgi:hypothetical protein
MGDGAVRWIPADIKPSDLLAMATRAGGEKLSADIQVIAPRVDRVVELKGEPKVSSPKSEDKVVSDKSSQPKAATQPETPSGSVQIAPSPREK